jgi:hypothetical protein
LQVHSINNADESRRTDSWKQLTVQTRTLKRKPPMGIFIRNNLPNNLDPEEKAQGWRCCGTARPPGLARRGCRRRFPPRAGR